MNHISESLPLFQYIPQKGRNERGDLLVEFSKKTGWPIGRVARKLKGIDDLQTLYYIKSRCDSDVREGRKNSWEHAFNSCLYTPK